MRRFAQVLIPVFTFVLVCALIFQVSATSPYLDERFSVLSPRSDVKAIWWSSSWHYRLSFSIYSGSYGSIDVPFETTVNFTFLLTQLEVHATFDENSIRVIEYNSMGEVLYEVPSQFDKASDYNADFNARLIVSKAV